VDPSRRQSGATTPLPPPVREGAAVTTLISSRATSIRHLRSSVTRESFSPLNHSSPQFVANDYFNESNDNTMHSLQSISGQLSMVISASC